MSNQHNPTASRPWLAKQVWMLPTALLTALVAILALTTTAALAQENIIQVVKPDVEVVTGNNVTIRLQVINGPAAHTLTNVQLLDTCSVGPTRVLPDTPGNGDNVLEAGEVWNFDCTINGVTQSFNNFAEVRALDGATPVSDSDAGQVTVLNRGVHLTKVKTAPVDPVLQGSNVTFDIFVRNTGTANIDPRTVAANLALSDPQCAVPPAGPGIQGPFGDDGDNILEADLDGGANTLADDEIWRYTCQINSVTDDFSNTATVNVRDVNGQTFSHIATVNVTVLNPGLAITKSPSKPVVTVNENVVWTIRVFNSGQLAYGPALANIRVTDTQCNPATGPVKTVADADDSLEPGEIWEYSCTRSYAAPGLQTNSASVAADRVLGGTTDNAGPVTSQVQVVAPGLLVTKEPPVQFVLQNGTALFQIKVTNTGGVNGGPLTVTSVSDPLCSAAPTYLGGDGNGNLMIDPANPPTVPFAETWTYTCSRTNVQQSFTNVVTVNAKDAANNAVAPQIAVATVNMIRPSLNIQKPDVQVFQNGTAIFNLTVSNNGNSELSDVAVTDTLCDAPAPGQPQVRPVTQAAPNTAFNLGDLDRDGKLDPGENWSYTCSKTNVQTDFTNIASVTAKDVLGNSISTSDTGLVDVLTPGLQVEKTPAFQVVSQGQEVKWTIRVKNTGQGDLFPVAPPAPLFNPAPGIGESLSCSTFTIVSADAALNPNEIWEYTCTIAGINTFLQDEFLNVVVARFQDGAGNPVVASERARALVITPGIDIEKSANPAVAVQGGSVEFTFEVRNLTTPPVDLLNVDVTDALCPSGKPTRTSGDTNGDNRLNPSEVWVYKCTVSNVTADFTNNSTVTASDPAGAPKRDTDNVSVIVLNAKINVVKTTTTPNVQQGQNVAFTIQAQNTGVQNLTTVSIADNQACQGGVGGAPTFIGGDANNNQIMEPGETWTWNCTVANAQADYTNTATVTAKEQSTNLLVTSSGSASVNVFRPGINLEKTPSTQSLLSGQPANFTLLVANTGNTGLTSVNLSDVQCHVGPTRTGGDTDNDNVLDPGETWVYSCTINNVTQSFTNSAAVTASSGAQGVVDTDSADVSVLNPGIRIDKTPDQQTVAAGGTANFTINVSNAGTAPLSNVVVNDPLCSAAPLVRTSGDTDNDNVLDPGEIWVYTCSIANVTQSFDNTASVSASTGAGTVNASDIAKVTVQTTPPPSGSLVLAQTVNPSTIVKGGSATFRATLANGTATNMTGITLSGDKCKSFTRLADAPGNNDAVLNSGETWVWQCVLTKVTKTTTNKVTAKVKTPKQTLTASIKLTVTSSRGLLIDEDLNEVSGVEVLIDGEGKVIDEAQLINKNYLPIVIGEEE